MTPPVNFEELSDDELRQRLLNKRVKPELTEHLVRHRDRDDVDAVIFDLLEAGE